VPAPLLVSAVIAVALLVLPLVGLIIRAPLLAFGRVGFVGRYLDSWFGLTTPFTPLAVVMAQTLWPCRGSALRESNPFNTPWRRSKGGLWDVGPHMISLLWASLGPVTSVTADAGPTDVTHLVLPHEGGATSTTTLTLSAAEAAAGFEATYGGESGRLAAPGGPVDQVTALSTALRRSIFCATVPR